LTLRPLDPYRNSTCPQHHVPSTMVSPCADGFHIETRHVPSPQQWSRFHIETRDVPITTMVTVPYRNSRYPHHHHGHSNGHGSIYSTCPHITTMVIAVVTVPYRNSTCPHHHHGHGFQNLKTRHVRTLWITITYPATGFGLKLSEQQGSSNRTPACVVGLVWSRTRSTKT
jgi:hypothetical protein